jgi:hypothetical protein
MGEGTFFFTARDLAHTSSWGINLREAHATGSVLFQLALTLI